MEFKTNNTNQALNEILERLDKMEDQSNSITQTIQKEWIDSQEVCLLLNISKRTLQNYRDTGKIPYSSVDGKMYYKYRDIMDILEKNYHPLKAKRNGRN